MPGRFGAVESSQLMAVGWLLVPQCFSTLTGNKTQLSQGCAEPGYSTSQGGNVIQRRAVMFLVEYTYTYKRLNLIGEEDHDIIKWYMIPSFFRIQG